MRKKLYIGVDSANFFLFHPADFEEDFHGDPEPPDSAFESALVMGLHLGADGHRGIELVLGELSLTEREHVTGPIVFPLRVNHGKLFATDRMAAVDEHEWDEEPAFELEPGYFEAKWYVLDDELSEKKKVNWIVTLRSVKSLAGLPEWRDFPDEDSFHLNLG